MFTDDEEKLFKFIQPVILTGVDEIVVRTDLLDRTVSLSLKAPEQRLEETVLWQMFNEARPAILGALYTTISKAMALLPDIRAENMPLPRMASYFLIGHAISRAMGHTSEEFNAAYAYTIREARDVALEANVAYAVLVSWLDRRRSDATRHRLPPPGPWQGNMANLLLALNEEREYMKLDERNTPKGWPGTPRGMSATIGSIIKQLGEVGIKVDFSTFGRKYTITDYRPEKTEEEIKREELPPDQNHVPMWSA